MVRRPATIVVAQAISLAIALLEDLAVATAAAAVVEGPVKNATSAARSGTFHATARLTAMAE